MLKAIEVFKVEKSLFPFPQSHTSATVTSEYLNPFVVSMSKCDRVLGDALPPELCRDELIPGHPELSPFPSLSPTAKSR